MLHGIGQENSAAVFTCNVRTPLLASGDGASRSRILHHGKRQADPRGDHRAGLRGRVHSHLSELSRRRAVRHLPPRPEGPATSAATATASRPATPITANCSRTRTSTRFISTRRFPTMPGCRSRASRPASMWPAPCRWAPRSTSAARSSLAQRTSGKTYMMMETVVYSREYLFVKELYDTGELGRLQFLRGSHQQDMDGWPELLAGPAPHVVRHALRQPLPGDPGQACRERGLPRLGPDSRRPDLAVRQPVRHRDRDFQDQGQRRRGRGYSQPV